MAESYTLNQGDPSNAAPMAEGPGMNDETFRSTVKAWIDDAVDYTDGFVAPERAKATRYYRGDKFGNEEEGRSQIVMTEVRDKTLAMLPDLLRVFTSSDKLGEFAPNNEQQVDQAEQQTEVANHVLYYDNPGFMILHSVLKDGLVRKLGVAKLRWSKDREITEAEFTGLDQGQVAVLHQTPDVEIVEGQSSPQPDGSSLFNIRIRRTINRDRIAIEAVPPEEFLISRDARSIQEANYKGHRALKSISDLVAMGYDRDVLEEHAGGDDVFVMNYEAQTRNPSINSFMAHPTTPDDTMRKVLYVESWVRIDRDGDGIAELRRVCTIGNAHYVLHEEVVDENDIVFAGFCPDPEPHMVIGASLADQVMDIQLLKSNVVRTTLDSLSETIRPRLVFVEGQVNPDDVLNNEVGAPIRARQPGMVQELNRTFLGREAMPVISWLDDLAAQRTGVTPASQGLDPDVLQSTTKAAVTATVNSAQARSELVARIFAETFAKDLFRGIRNMLCRHQDRPRTLRLNGKWVTVDPRYWDADLDFHVNVGLGRGSAQDEIQNLVMIATKIEQIIQTLGPANPLSDVQNLRNAYAKIVARMGFKDVNTFFKQVNPQVIQRAMQSAQKPDPNMLVAQAEMMKAQTDAQQTQAKASTENQKVLLDHQRDLIKLKMDWYLRLAQIESQAKSQVNIAQIEAQIDSLLGQHATNTQAAVDVHGNLLDHRADMVKAQNAAAAPAQ